MRIINVTDDAGKICTQINADDISFIACDVNEAPMSTRTVTKVVMKAGHSICLKASLGQALTKLIAKHNEVLLA